MTLVCTILGFHFMGLSSNYILKFKFQFKISI